MKRKVLIASPIRQKKEILTEFLESLELLDTSGLDVDFVFTDDLNDHDLLNAFAKGKANIRIFSTNTDDSYLCDETTHHWQENLVWKVARFKDEFIKLALEEEYDDLFLVDSDLYLHPKTLIHLISLGKDIVSEVFWTKWVPGIQPLPQVWLGDEYRLYHAARGGELTEEQQRQRSKEFL